ncbi:MAG: DUF2116 family Zn-ribbon domain-containing protein [Thaumarchaeota archaeon]|nr:DUF2116 family Zn-ribbon domain-containing protein [Nitrososphaerota archaeon]
MAVIDLRGMSKQEQRIVPHQHCKVCGKAVPLGREVCSNECREKSAKTQRRTKTIGRIYTVVLLIVMAALMLFTVLAPR